MIISLKVALIEETLLIISLLPHWYELRAASTIIQKNLYRE